MFHRLPPLNSLRAFEVISRHSTIRAAARELHVTAAAVSQQVKLLEQQIGRKLLRRCSGGYVLTAVGLAGAADLQAAFERLAAAVAKMSHGPRRALTISVTPSLAATWLVPRLHDFERQHPDIDLLLHSSEEVVDLSRSAVDVALRYGSGSYAGTDSVRLFDGDLFPVCSPRLIRTHGPMRTPADLAGKPLLHVDWTPEKGVWPGWAGWMKAAGIKGVDSNKGTRFSEHALAIQAAVAGRGLALASTALVLDHLQARRLIRPLRFSIATDFAYHVVVSNSQADNADIAAFRQWVLGQARR